MTDFSTGLTGSTSASLIARVKLRDSEAWERFAQLYSPLVYGWARRGGLRDSDAADIVQEVFSAVTAKIDDFQKNRENSSFRAWLWAITRNLVRLHYRRAAQRPEAKGGSTAVLQLQQYPEFLEQDADPSGIDDRRALVHRALRLIRKDFTERNWRAFWQLAIEGQGAAEIAEELGMTASAVRQAKYRVLCRLREELEGG